MPEYLARDIVENIKEIINQDINYIDTDAVIIASTNISRVGTFHGGARRVLKKKDEVIIQYDGEYEGTKQGINLPVFFQNDIVGVIGITGSEEEVGKYGKIIKQMTEILIKEAYVVEQEKIERESRKQFIEELLYRIHNEDKRTLNMRSELLNIRIDIPRIVMVARIYQDYDNNAVSTPLLQEKVYNFIRSYIDFNKQNLIIQSGMNYILILDKKSLNDISSLAESIHDSIKDKYEIKLCFGIGRCSIDVDEMRKSYEEAKKALDVVLVTKEKYVMNYSDLDTDLLLNEVSDLTKDTFIDGVFKKMKPTEIDGYMEILIRYFKNNGSITKTADELFIHKNTLQYKLNKLNRLTGYDPRITKDMVVLYLAVKIYGQINNK
ncbi:CdaR family transcriptional regulator [Natronincola peptidivorans]|uniref:CdaR family transcriptional regulator n=1 Tax=Natronincola peptidivorans TaxID=426128 RepID=UPI001FCA823E|nr:sugar diacid recognition domain-containing protein [Natronincola peptidivorans]